MALREGVLGLKFAGGLETKADPKSVPTARLLGLENAVFTRAISLSKRAGYESLGQSVLGEVNPYDGARGIGVRGDELVLFTDDTSYSYVEGASAWHEIGGIHSVKQSDRALVKVNAKQTLGDYAAVSGIGLAAWEDSRGGVYYALVEDNEGRVLIGPSEASSTATRPRCVRCGDKLVLLWAEAALGQIKTIVFDPASPHTYDKTAFPRVIIADLVVAVPNYDATYTPASGSTPAAACIAWNATGGIRAGWLDPSGVIGSPVTGWPSPATRASATAVVAGPAICVPASAPATWYVAWSEAGDAYVTNAFSTVVAVGTPVALNPPNALGVSGVDAVALAVRSEIAPSLLVEVWLEDRTSPARNSVVTQATFNALTLGVTAKSFRGASLASCGWTDPPYDGSSVTHAYVTLVHDVPLQGVYMTIRDDGLVVARTLPGVAGDAPARAHLPRAFDDGASGRSYRWTAVYKNRLDALNKDVFTEEGLRLVTLDYAASDSHQSVYAGRTLYLGGACTMAYDGAGWVEASPHYAPDWESGETLHVNSGAGTGGMTNGTRNYVFWYEATLANGEIIRGPTSKPYTVTISGADDRVTISVPTLRLTEFGQSGRSRENLRVCAARTKDGNTALYYRITSLDPTTVGAANGYVANTLSADSVLVVDDLSDDTLATRDPLYTTGDIPSNDAIPGQGVIAAGKNRVFVGDPSDSSAIYYSQERADGYAVEWTPELRIVTPPGGGAITGVAVMDDLLVVFKRNAIYGVTGDGPLANPAAGGGWSLPGLITSDVGCVDQRTIVTTPVGLMFQSAKGIYLLDRGKSVTYVGAPVEAYNGSTITRATLVEDTHQVRFLTDAGVALLYDYFFGQWSTFTGHGGIDSAIVSGVYHYLRTDGRVFRQADSYADDNAQIPLVIETAWIRFRDLIQGFQRVWHAQVIGTWRSAHVLRVQWMTDYDVDGNWSEPVEFDATTMGGSNYGSGNYGAGNYGGDSPTPYQFTAHVGRKCQAIRFRFTFVEAYGAAGACAELTELIVTGGVKGNRYKLPESRTK